MFCHYTAATRSMYRSTLHKEIAEVCNHSMLDVLIMLPLLAALLKKVDVGMSATNVAPRGALDTDANLGPFGIRSVNV